jgi:hypothetical protein
MIGYWDRGYEWMGYGLQGLWCPSFAHNQLQSPDISGSANHGTLFNFANNGNNAIVTSGDGKGALEFNGANNFGLATIPSLTGFITLSAWVRGIPGSGSSLYFLACPNTPGGNCIDFMNPTNVATNIVNSAGGLTTLSSGIDTRGSWTHLCSGVDGSRAFFFVNGNLVSSTSLTLGINGTALRQINLGRFSSIGFYTAVQLDDVRLYSRGLTTGEAVATYAAGRGGGLLYEPPRRKSYFVPPASGWQSYWFRNQQRMIGGGIR